MEELRDYLAALIERYRQQPVEWQASMDRVESAVLQRAPGPGEWSPHQVIAHVMAADRFALQPRLRRIMEEDKPNLPNWDEQAWMADSYESQAELSVELTDWHEQRRQLADRLAGLELSGWNRVGWHPLRGERTLLWWLEYAVKHAAEHKQQLGEIMVELDQVEAGAGQGKEAT